MTSRERVLAAIEFRGPDRVPVHNAVFPGAFWRHGEKLVRLLSGRPDDFGNSVYAIPSQPEGDGDFEEVTDAWGSVWLRLKGYTAGEVKKPILASWEDWPKLRPPEHPSRESLLQFARECPDGPREWFAAPGGVTLFEQMQWIRGPENLYADLAAPDAGIEKLADLMVEWNLELICRYLRAGADAVYFADDWGAQHRLLIRPSLWRQFFKPRYARMIAPVREAGRHVFFHTDGWTCDIWDDLIDVGVTVLNPQHPLMPDDLLERRLSGQVCIRTDLDRQRVLPFGSPQEVREEVKRAVSLFGSVRGGLILHGEIGPDVPWDNIVALYEAYDEFGGSRSERT